ncbi:hypothetical protein [Aeromonas dhakensis]|uniref:hypothetical protein n=1 Tax=Aeromonas dhakensis TaxID=196024 RepID=UPI0012FDEBE3|nr:hypothetical protein [Aeromonas dhakensis]
MSDTKPAIYNMSPIIGDDKPYTLRYLQSGPDGKAYPVDLSKLTIKGAAKAQYSYDPNTPSFPLSITVLNQTRYPGAFQIDFTGDNTAQFRRDNSPKSFVYDLEWTINVPAKDGVPARKMKTTFMQGIITFRPDVAE